ncbi:MAG TPA: MFS transporter [Caulobacteraceae bacterium]|nr:MFS transporter [Caulobacteraceae bacterium]
MSQARQKPGTLAAFAGPCLPLAALGLPLVVYLPEYYSNALGLPLAAVGAAFMGVRLLDILFDPFIGGVMDRTRTKWGRFRPWLALGAPLLIVASYMLFMAKPGVSVGYLWLWLIVVYAGLSICVLAHTAWGSILSADYNQRSRIYTWWQAGNVVGMILVLVLPPLLENAVGGDHAAGIQAMGWFIIVLLPLTIGASLMAVPEPVAPVERHRAGLREYAGLLKRPTIQRILIADLLLGLAPGITGALFFFYFERVKDFDKGEAGILLLIYFLSALVCAPIWTRLARKIGKHKALSVAGVVYAVVQTLIVIMPNGNFALAVPGLILAGLPYSAGPFLLRSMLADVGDEERLASGADRTGLLYAILAGTAKIGYALAVGITFVALDVLGFNAQGGGDPQAGMAGLQALFVVGPAVLGLVAAWVCFGYPLDENRHAEIQDQLAARDAIPPVGTELDPDAVHVPAQ